MRSLVRKSAIALFIGASLPMAAFGDITESTPPSPAGMKDHDRRHSPYEPGNYQAWRRVHSQPSKVLPAQPTQLALAKSIKRSPADEAMVAEALNTLATVEKPSTTPDSKPAPKSNRRWMFWRKKEVSPIPAVVKQTPTPVAPRRAVAATTTESEVRQVAAQEKKGAVAKVQAASAKQSPSSPQDVIKADAVATKAAESIPNTEHHASPRLATQAVLPPPPKVTEKSMVATPKQSEFQLPFPESNVTPPRKAPAIPQSVAEKYRTKWPD